MQSAGKAPSHIRKVHAILSSAYGTAVKRGKIARNPLVLVDAPSVGSPEKEVLSLREVQTVLNEAARRANAARWSVGLALGLRQGEALGLRWQHLDLDSGVARIAFQLQRPSGGMAAPIPMPVENTCIARCAANDAGNTCTGMTAPQTARSAGTPARRSRTLARQIAASTLLGVRCVRVVAWSCGRSRSDGTR